MGSSIIITPLLMAQLEDKEDIFNYLQRGGRRLAYLAT